jgi:rubrerythrin
MQRRRPRATAICEEAINMASEKAWDLSKYQPEDIYRMAITVEQGGFDYYNKIIESTDNKRVKNEMAFLRDEEARHKAFFQKQLAGKGSGEKKITAELQKLLEAEFLKPMDEMYKSKKIGSNADALRFGMDIEQKTVDFYTALKQKQNDPEFGKDLDVIIDEERKHKQKLNIILAY